jgi:hypothetical protein
MKLKIDYKIMVHHRFTVEIFCKSNWFIPEYWINKIIVFER